jgi:hypothetical protein
MKKIYHALKMLLVLIFIFGKNAQSQTIINYETWGGSASCNIFGISTDVNGHTHLSTIGQPEYSGTNKTVNLECSPTSSGTEYQIAYPFKQGFRYTITVKAASIISGYPNFLRLDLKSTSSTASTQCTGPKTISTATTGGFKQGILANIGAYHDYPFDYPELSAPLNYLLIAAVPAPGGSNQEILIRRVTIEEIPVNPPLELSPTNVSTVCGTDHTQTFTVSNPYNVTDITSYEWNLNSANGWKYNGGAAPLNISTTTNTLTLTADGCRTGLLSPITVTVKRNGAPYKSYGAVSQTNPPTNLSIAGVDVLCSGSSDYTINNLPCNSQVTWSVGAGGGDLSCTNCAQTNLSVLTDGTTTLYASIQLPCRPNPIVLYKFVNTGSPNPLNGLTFSPGAGAYTEPFMQMFGSSMNVQLPALANYTSYSWALRADSDPAFSVSEPSPGIFSVNYSGLFTNGQKGTILFTVTHPLCGTYTRKLTFYIDQGEGQLLKVQASPVPANNKLDVSLGNADNNQTIQARRSAAKISRVQIVDKMGNIKIDRTFGVNISDISVDVSGLLNDVYIVKVFDGKKWWSRQIIVQH